MELYIKKKYWGHCNAPQACLKHNQDIFLVWSLPWSQAGKGVQKATHPAWSINHYLEETVNKI